MTKSEWAAIVAYVEAGCGKKLEERALAVYFDLLQDLPTEAVQVAAKRALLASEYPTFPQPGTLRRFATESLAPPELTPLEAWGMVRGAIRSFGYYRQKQGLASLPPLIRQAVEALGWVELCDATEPEIVRAQFSKAFDTLLQRQRKAGLLPLALQKQIGQLIQNTAEPMEKLDHHATAGEGRG